MRCKSTQRNAMQCHAMLCNATPRYAMSPSAAMHCYAMLRSAMQCYLLLLLSSRSSEVSPFRFLGPRRSLLFGVSVLGGPPSAKACLIELSCSQWKVEEQEIGGCEGGLCEVCSNCHRPTATRKGRAPPFLALRRCRSSATRNRPQEAQA